MNVEELRLFINALANREQTGNSLSPNEYNSYLARANEDLFRKEVGIREQPNGTIFFDNSQVSTDALLPFIKESPITVINGFANLPTDYRHTVSATNSVNNKIVTFLTKREFDEILTDSINFPTDIYPCATFVQGELKLRPLTTTSLNFTYLRKPAVPFWNYTIINDEPVYDPTGSVQIEFPEITHITFARLILGYMSIQFRDADLLQYAMKVQAAGV